MHTGDNGGWWLAGVCMGDGPNRLSVVSIGSSQVGTRSVQVAVEAAWPQWLGRDCAPLRGNGRKSRWGLPFVWPALDGWHGVAVQFPNQWLLWRFWVRAKDQ